MSTPRECRLSAEICLRLARETRDIYARNGLIELAADFRVMADEMEREARHTIRSTELLTSPGRIRQQRASRSYPRAAQLRRDIAWR
jgi:hypothetical protein